jgi:hypothetical protein
MPTDKQSAASRANAQKSTGPRSAEGKAASRFNALKHGIHAETQIMFDETPEDLAELAAEFHDHYRPADPNQRLLVDTLVNNEWRLRRMRRVEASLWMHAGDTFLNRNIELEAASTGNSFAAVSGPFVRLQQIVNSCERNYHRALKELQRAIKATDAQPDAEVAQKPTPTGSEPEPSKPTSASSASFRQNSPAAPESAQPSPQTPANPVAHAAPAGSLAVDRDRKLPEAA